MVLMFYNRDANFLNIRTFSRTNGVFCSAPSSDCRCSLKCLYVLAQVCPEPEAATSEREGHAATAEPSDQPQADLWEPFPQLVKLLADVPSVQQLLCQAARKTLDDLDQEVELVHPVLKSWTWALRKHKRLVEVTQQDSKKSKWFNSLKDTNCFSGSNQAGENTPLYLNFKSLKRGWSEDCTANWGTLAQTEL